MSNLISVSDERAVDGEILVNRFNVITTSVVVYQAWEKTSGLTVDHYGREGGHSTITRFDQFGRDGWFGRIGTRRVPAEMDRLPGGSAERIEVVGGWFEKNYRESVEAIFEAFPHLATTRNEIRIRGGEVEEIFQTVELAEIETRGIR